MIIINLPAVQKGKIKEKKKDKYFYLAIELRKLWNVRETAKPIVTDPFWEVTKGLERGLEDLEIIGRTENILTLALLRLATLRRRVMKT